MKNDIDLDYLLSTWMRDYPRNRNYVRITLEEKNTFTTNKPNTIYYLKSTFESDARFYVQIPHRFQNGFSQDLISHSTGSSVPQIIVS